LQQVIEHAQRLNRKVFISGRSMETNVEIAQNLGYIKAPRGLIRKVGPGMDKIPDKEVIIITTGSQGEEMAGLARIGLGTHRHISIKKGDTVVLSSSPIVGNERAIHTVVNNLCKLGAKVISNQIMDVHTSGHAQQEDLKLMINLVNPKYLIPIHGELYMRQAHADVATSINIPEKNCILASNGSILDINNKQELTVSPEKAESNYIMVDGLGVGDIGTQIMAERQILAQMCSAIPPLQSMRLSVGIIV